MTNLELIQIYEITINKVSEHNNMKCSLSDRLDGFLKKIVNELEVRLEIKQQQSTGLISDILPLLKKKIRARSLRECAKEIGIGHSTLSRIVIGKTPDLNSFAKISRWLNPLDNPDKEEETR